MKLHWLAALMMLGEAVAAAQGESATNRINLDSVLRLAGVQPLVLELARERVREARSQHEQDRRQWLPWLAPGVGFRRHDGNLQDIAGSVFDASKQSGSAALTLQAQLDLGESLFRTLASRQELRAVQSEESAQQRHTIATAATLYAELGRTHAAIGTANDAVRISDDLVRQVSQAAEAGLAYAGDVQRAVVQRARNDSRLSRAREEARLASVRLAQVLRLPPALQLLPDLDDFTALTLVDTNQPLDSLVASALGRRPELHRAEARIAAAQNRRLGTTRGPWIPTLGAQAALGGMAGGRNGDFGNADDFQDYGVSLSWRIGPGGLGDRSRIRTADARLRIAELGREQERDSIVAEVVEASSRCHATLERLEAATRAVTAATRLLELTGSRREFGVGAVMEGIEAERELTQTRLDQVQAIADHNRAQWDLWRAVGDTLPDRRR